MKKLFSLLTVSLVFIATSFANTKSDPGNKRLTAELAKYFSTAESVSWNKTAMFTTANFILDGQYLAAHFSPEAKMLGISKNVAAADLPLNMKLELKDYFDRYWISDIFEFATPGSDAFYVTLENADSKLVLRSAGGEFEVYKRTAKNS